MQMMLIAQLSAPIAAASGSHLASEISDTLSRLAAQDRFSGAALVAKGNHVLLDRAFGYADHAFAVKNGIDTKFNIASMGKMFTGVAILQLVQAGKISLDDRLIKDLPAYPNRVVANKITIRQLLTHTSGLRDFFGPKFAAGNMSRFDTLESLLPFFVNEPLLFKPGSSWQYSNAGYIVLGMVIAHVSGESYYHYVQRHIFDVCGMHDTGNWPADQDIPNRANGYTNMTTAPGAPRKSNVFFLQRGGSAGGGYSTVGDLWRFAQALQQKKLLNAAYTKLDLEGHVATGRPGVRYGFGMEEKIINGVRILGHSGGGPGIQGVLDIYPDSGYIVSILANYDDAAMAADLPIRFALTGAPKPRGVVLSREAIEAVTGSYVPVLPRGAGMKPPPIVITAEAAGIKVDPGMGPAFHFVPVSATEFTGSDDAGLRITFVKGLTGRVTGLKTTGFGPVPPISAIKRP